MERYICIHAHFYQPPRENPWLETVEVQDSAYPFHDWNQRIASECYAANASARILDGEGCIAEITNNYSKISFNFGPTLLSWMEKQEPEIYRAVLEADVVLLAGILHDHIIGRLQSPSSHVHPILCVCLRIVNSESVLDRP